MQKVLKNISDDRLRAHVIWLPMFPGDSRDWAKTRSDEFNLTGVAFPKAPNKQERTKTFSVHIDGFMKSKSGSV